EPFKLLIPAPEITAPAKAPIKACEEDDGIPYHQVIRFQAIAPISALITIGIPCSRVAGSATPPPIIFATPVKATAPTKLITAANATATLGFNARVEIDVALALAVSSNPLIKSNASAKNTTATKRYISIIMTSTL